jgi:hypothetical protein
MPKKLTEKQYKLFLVRRGGGRNYFYLQNFDLSGDNCRGRELPSSQKAAWKQVATFCCKK